MFFQRALAAALAGVALLAQSATGHSTERNPLSSVLQVDDAIIHTASHRVHALRPFELSFYLHNRKQKVRLSLHPNFDILAEDAAVQYVGADGVVHAIEPIDRHEHKVYKGDAFIRHEGHSEWTNAGWARINIHQDGDRPIFEGAFRLDGVHHHVQTSARYRQTMVAGDPEIEFRSEEYMIVWRDSDVIELSSEAQWGHDDLRKRMIRTPLDCSSDQLLYNRDESNLAYRADDVSLNTVNARNLFGRQIDDPTGGNGAGVNLTSTIGNTNGCPTSRKVALIGIATDCNYAGLFASNATVRSNVIQQINTASQVYESAFNISLGIQNLTIVDSKCPATPPSATPWNQACSDSVSITDRLNLFSKWRGDNSDSNAYWTLLSNCPTGAAVGLAWLGQICQQGSHGDGNETIAAANVVVHTSTEWQVIAHEAGHTFGAVHDCISTTCSDGTVSKQQCCPLDSGSCDAKGQFLMNPSTGSSITKFSACSVGNICSFLGRASSRTQCLTNNRDVVTITGSECGNGIVESGEECDCGGESGCGTNSCCDAKTCKLTTNSVCDPANEECCTSQCQFAASGKVCRASTGVCDPQETCSGTSASCPSDVTTPDGSSCGASGAGLTCASGQCTSRNLQCKTLMGSLTSSNDTYSCSNDGCVLSCASPEFGYNTCYTMQQNFLDGTPCEGGGQCRNGNCEGSSLGNRILEWINNNKPIFIPVAVIVGLLLLVAIVTCIFGCPRRRRPARMPKPPPAGFVQYGGGPAPPMAAVTRGARGPRRERGPAAPPGQPPLRGSSFRYA
ncbi:hypothetical protein GQ53DRAFT_262642 [Thozetella sp. PMI_491]|nr:hypothetical protein GQ53DRAFT_262642 [Thozetella sp. PMI_491]